MQFDEAAKRRILSLSDAQLAELIGKISEAAGGDPRRSRSLMNDLTGVRRTLEAMSPQDAEKLLDSVDSRRSEEIYRILREGR